MSDTVEYDEEAARKEAQNYETAAARERRRTVRDALALDGDESVLSVGCGPGFEPAELADAVGEGRVVGVDRSPAMLALARERCADRPNAALARGDAIRLPVETDRFDAAVAVQVYEYVAELDAALAELRRVLRPGGRAVLYATDWDATVWHARDRERTARILDAWRDHCERPHLGSRLRGPLDEAGFVVEDVAADPILNTSLDDTFAGHLLEFVESYAADHEAVGPDVAAAWADDLRRLDAAGETLFELTQFRYRVTLPASPDGARTSNS